MMSLLAGTIWGPFNEIFGNANDGEDGASDRAQDSEGEDGYTFGHSDGPGKRETERGELEKWWLGLPEGEELQNGREDEGKSCTGHCSDERDESVQIWNT